MHRLTTFCPITIGLFLLFLNVGTVAHAGEVLVLEKGGQAKIGDPYKKRTMGLSREGSKRTVFVRFENVQVPHGGNDVTAVATTKFIHLKGAIHAAPGLYRVNPTIRVEEQIYTRIKGRQYEWVKTREKTVVESFEVLIEYPPPPEIRMLAGSQVTFSAPEAVTFDKIKSTSKGLVEVAAFGREVTLQAHKKGKSRILVEYSIGVHKRTQRWTVRVLDEIPGFEELLQVGDRTRIQFNELPKALKVDSIKILSIDPQTTGTIATVDEVDGHIELVARKEGVGEAVVRLLGKKRKKLIWFVLPIKVDIAARPSGSPQPAGGKSPPPGEAVEEDEAEDPIGSPPRPATPA